MGKDAIYVPDRASEAFHSITEERQRQEDKWGQQDHDTGLWLAILGEEYGEVAKEIAEASARPLDVAHLREELVQTAAVAAAWIEAIDRARLEYARDEGLVSDGS